MSNEDFENFDSEVLGKGKKNGDMLDMDRGSGIKQVRNDSGQRTKTDFHPSAELGNPQRRNPERPLGFTQVRQPAMRESEPSLPGNEQGKCPRHDPKRETISTEKDPLQERASVVGGEFEDSTGPEKMPDLSSFTSPEVLPKKEITPDQRHLRQSSTLAADSRGQLIGGTLEEQYRLATAYSRSGLMPKALNTPEKVLVALQLCRELDLPAMSSIGKIMVVNGTPAIFGDLPLALVMRSGKLKNIAESWQLDANGAAVAATCTVQRIGLEPVTRSFSVEDAKRAGLFRNDIWTKYQKRMLQCRARAWALKDVFPDTLSGVSIAEWDFDSTDPEAKGAAERKSIADELTQAALETETDSKPEGSG